MNKTLIDRYNPFRSAPFAWSDKVMFVRIRPDNSADIEIQLAGRTITVQAAADMPAIQPWQIPAQQRLACSA